MSTVTPSGEPVSTRADPTHRAQTFLRVLAGLSGIGIVALLSLRKPLPGDLVVVASTTLCGLAAVRLRRIPPVMVADYAHLAVRLSFAVTGGLVAFVFNNARAGHPPQGWAIAGLAGVVGLFAAWLSPPTSVAPPFDERWATDVYRRAATMLGVIGLSGVGVSISAALFPADTSVGAREFLVIGTTATGALLSSVAPHAAENVPARDSGLAGTTRLQAFAKGLAYGLADEQTRAISDPVTRVVLSSHVACTMLGFTCVIAILGCVSVVWSGHAVPDELVGIIAVTTGTLTGWLVSPPPKR